MTKAQKARRIKQLEKDAARWQHRQDFAYSKCDTAICSSITELLHSYITILESTVEID